MLPIRFFRIGYEGALLPQMLELWDISKTQFGILMSIYGVVHNILYVALAWVQDRFSARAYSGEYGDGGLTTFFLGQTTDFVSRSFAFVCDVVALVRRRFLASGLVGRAQDHRR